MIAIEKKKKKEENSVVEWFVKLFVVYEIFQIKFFSCLFFKARYISISAAILGSY